MITGPQLDAFVTPPSAPGSATSREAAERHRWHANGQRSKVLATLAAAGPDGLTRHEIAERLGVPLASVCGRVCELVELGFVYPTVRRREHRQILIAAPRLG